jgi:hypothetical protein
VREKRNDQAFRLAVWKFDSTRFQNRIEPLPGDLTGQTNPALGSTPVDDSSTLLGRHSFEKTMISGPF